MPETVPVKTPKRKARDERLPLFDRLADFANLGDEPQDWARFRLNCRESLPSECGFFPPEIEKWIYDNAIVWRNLSKLPSKLPPNYQELLDERIKAWTPTDEEWALIKNDVTTSRSPLLFYRDLLRSVWEGKDPSGNCLGVLLGFEDACAAIFEPPGEPVDMAMLCDEVAGWLFNWKAPEGPREQTVAGARYLDKRTVTSYYLPLGRPWVDGKSSTIKWEFGCQFQIQLYHLMQEPKRRGICAECHKYFVKDKAIRKYCSENCYQEKKRKESLERYYRVMKARRKAARAEATARKRKSANPNNVPT
jgi:hypothetical protein